MENVIHVFWAPGTRSLVQRIRFDAVDPVIRIDIGIELDLAGDAGPSGRDRAAAGCETAHYGTDLAGDD